MNFLLNLFKKSSTSNFTNKHGEEYFQMGFDFYRRAVNTTGENWKMKRGVFYKKALTYFDKAIEVNYKNARVFALRGDILYDLEYYYDALEDYNTSLSLDPIQGFAHSYWKRGMIKHSLFDYLGSKYDLITAINLSLIDNEDNRFWNQHAKNGGFGNTATEWYKWDLETLIEPSIRFYGENHELDIEEKERKLSTIKLRKNNHLSSSL